MFGRKRRRSAGHLRAGRVSTRYHSTGIGEVEAIA